MGGDPAAGGALEVRGLNRVSRRLPTGITMEADLRHAELSAAMLGAGCGAYQHAGSARGGRGQG